MMLDNRTFSVMYLAKSISITCHLFDFYCFFYQRNDEEMVSADEDEIPDDDDEEEVHEVDDCLDHYEMEDEPR